MEISLHPGPAAAGDSTAPSAKAKQRVVRSGDTGFRTATRTDHAATVTQGALPLMADAARLAESGNVVRDCRARSGNFK